MDYNPYVTDGAEACLDGRVEKAYLGRRRGERKKAKEKTKELKSRNLLTFMLRKTAKTRQ
ncbi:MAG: hypothetical protein ACUVTX_01870 [Bacteroidales bacterium]